MFARRTCWDSLNWRPTSLRFAFKRIPDNGLDSGHFVIPQQGELAALRPSRSLFA